MLSTRCRLTYKLSWLLKPNANSTLNCFCESSLTWKGYVIYIMVKNVISHGSFCITFELSSPQKKFFSFYVGIMPSYIKGNLKLNAKYGSYFYTKEKNQCYSLDRVHFSLVKFWQNVVSLLIRAQAVVSWDPVLQLCLSDENRFACFAWI